MADNEPAGLDFNELARLITAELDSGLTAINALAAWNSRFHISTMRVHIGQLPAEDDEPAPVTDVTEVPVLSRNVLTKQRYQLADRGWMLAVELAAGSAPARFKVLDEPIVTVPVETQSSASLLFRDLPVDAIRGVDSSWTQYLNDYKIVTVGELIEMDYELRTKLVSATNRNYPLIIHTRARQLLCAVPHLPKSKVDGASLYSLLAESPSQLRKKFGEQYISISASERFADFLALLYSVLDSRVLKSFSVLQLREIAQKKSAAKTESPS